MPKSYAPEFRRRMVELVRSGRSAAGVAADVGVSEVSVYRFARDQVDRGERPGLSSLERVELLQAKRRIDALRWEVPYVSRVFRPARAGRFGRQLGANRAQTTSVIGFGAMLVLAVAASASTSCPARRTERGRWSRNEFDPFRAFSVQEVRRRPRASRRTRIRRVDAEAFSLHVRAG